LNSTLTFVFYSGGFDYYKGPATSNHNYARNTSTGVWWVYSYPHSRWCTMNLSSPC
jgi:hypothetical protein